MLSVLLAIFCLFTSIDLAKSAYGVLITGDKRNETYFLCEKTYFNVYLEYYPNCYWIFDNADDFINTGIQSYGYRKTESSNFGVNEDGQINGSVFDFSFRFTNGTIEELPPLKFLYISEDGKESIHAQVNLIPNKICGGIRYNFLYYDNNDDDEYLEINNKEAYSISITGAPFTDNTFSTRYSWYFENYSTLEANGLIEITQYESGIINVNKTVNSQYRYSFKVNEIPKNDALPVLIFNLKDSPESKDIKKTKIIHLRAKDEIYFDIKDQMNLKRKSLNVKKNEVINIEFDNTPSADHRWHLENIDEIKKLNSIELLNVDENGEVPFIAKGSINPNTPGKYTFKFHINENSKSGTVEPALKFVQSKSGGDVTSSTELSLLIKKDRKEEDLNDTSLPVVQANTEENVIYVESNSILKVAFNYYPAFGSYWDLLNEFEIDRSEAIDLIEKHSDDACVGIALPYCFDIVEFLFRIWEVTNEDELPIIKFEYNPEMIKEDKKSKEFILKLKKSTTSDCSMNGYKCCSDSHAKIVYQDNDGEWSIEDNEWCIIKKEEEEKEPKLIRTCINDALGYSCCKERKILYTDSFGQWGVENGDWCVIPSCIYTGDYPVCKTTTKVVYTDTEKWGVENNNWCVICL